MAVKKDLCVFYLHGFKSSPASSKAVMIGQWLAKQGVAYECPALDISPLIALDQIETLIDERLTQGLSPRLIGSSLGGFYATWFMEQHPAKDQMRAALLNPACWPSRDLADHVGTHKAWHSDEILAFRDTYLQDLKAMEVGLSQPERYLVVAAQGDELLDWRDMVARYPGAQHLVISGSDHGLSDFANHWPTVADFLLH